MQDIFQRLRNGEIIPPGDEGFETLNKEVAKSREIVNEMNRDCHSQESLQTYLSRLTDSDVDSSVRIFLPFYTAYGKNIRLGKNVFINFNCTFLDLGGITLEDGVFIGPNTCVITENHPEEEELRHGLYTRPILIKRNAWIGAGVMILPGITIGENAIVGAGSIVTKDVPANTIVAGNPARPIRKVKAK